MADVFAEVHPVDAAEAHAPTRPQIGCDEAEAMRYMGCSRTMFEELRRRRIIVPIRKGYYSYRLLDLAMAMLEDEALKAARVVPLFNEPGKTKSPTKVEPVSTFELLARLRADGQ